MSKMATYLKLQQGARTYHCACGLPERLDVQTGKSEPTTADAASPADAVDGHGKRERLTAGERHRGLE